MFLHGLTNGHQTCFFKGFWPLTRIYQKSIVELLNCKESSIVVHLCGSSVSLKYLWLAVSWHCDFRT